MFTQTELAFRVLVSVAMRDTATINYKKFALVVGIKDPDDLVTLIGNLEETCAKRNVPNLTVLLSTKKRDDVGVAILGYDEDDFSQAASRNTMSTTCRIWAQGILAREAFYCTVCEKPLWNEASDIHAACMDKSDDARDDTPEAEEVVLTPDA